MVLFRENIDSSLSSTRVLLKLLTKTFLLDTDLPDFTANTTLKKAIMAHRTSFTTLNATLNDAKLEFFSLEMTKHSDGYEKIVKSLQRLAQHVGGLRSSCGLQVQVMQSSNTNDKNSSYGVIPNIKTMTHSRSKNQRVYNLKGDSQRKKMENEMKHERILEGLNKFKDSNSFEYDPLSLASNNSDIDKRKEGALVQFIRTVRSPMKSLAYTCKQTIIHLQTRFRGETKLSTPSFELMRQNLLDAIKLFEESQHQALIRFYKRKIKKEDQQKEPKYDEMHSHLIKKFPTDDIFLVYFFVFCLLEFAKELMILVDNVQLVYDNVDELDKTSNVIVWFKHLFLKGIF